NPFTRDWRFCSWFLATLTFLVAAGHIARVNSLSAGLEGGECDITAVHTDIELV
ncbi:Chorismate synthase, partial [Clarias magur]